ncbi:SDR family NAD(P)-dependent oxidoreductase [Rhodalgimonas zhirmunskyi]|uniref:SDR family NAD(P)-dependent oxidoreductase n=1 Tax=Rhodalgimonas zhirmunskyi TaxID=2964767 RepID=A0AAJ1U3I5_9RHOB|nr:SDR family NAD(P)-dependent oxidoreductase [Rhodoalgimonas zhirmunskyi]MDQ2093010.1 SDR family NAD(P)-dependent oxidoreductase [Rhodoalgimonas zhirmunskyi]
MSQHVVITGANRGIGAALAAGYKAQGWTVTACSRSGETGTAFDVTDPASIDALAQSLDGTPVDLLICNAGVYLDKGHNLADGYPPQMWADEFAVNVTGVFLTVQALMPNLQMAGTEQQSGKIAIISSQMASDTHAPGGSYIYRASKAAALNLGRNLATDLKAIGVPVGIYHPGWVQTDMGGGAADITTEQSRDGLMERFTALDLPSTGCFETWDGRAHAF